MKPKLLEGNVGSHLVQLTLPMVLGVFSVIAFSLTDTYFVAQLGTHEIAAMSFTFPVVMVLNSIAMGLGTGVSSVIARAIGEGNRRQVQQMTTDSLTLSLLIVGIFAGLGFSTINPLFSALGADSNILPLVRDYMSIWYLGIVFLVVPIVGNSAIRASGNTAVPSLIMIIAAVVNIGLDPILIFGWGSVPALGIRGAALATVLSRAATLVASLAFLHYRERLLVIALPNLGEMWTCWKSIFLISLPVAGTNLIAPISAGLSTSLIAYYGSDAVAGFGIASKVEAFALIVPIALSAGLSPFVGQNWGAKQYGRVRRALQLGFWFCLAWGALIAAVVGASATEIASLFDGDAVIIGSVTAYLKIVPLSYGILGVVLMYCSTFNALGQPLPSVVITVSRLLLLYIPLAFLGSWLFGVNGIFGAACLSNMVVGIGLWLWQSRWNYFQKEKTSVNVQLQSDIVFEEDLLEPQLCDVD